MQNDTRGLIVRYISRMSCKSISNRMFVEMLNDVKKYVIDINYKVLLSYENEPNMTTIILPLS